MREIVAGRSKMQAYICGLNDMVDANRTLLKEELGWDRKQIVFERYDYDNSPKMWPPFLRD